MDYYGKMLQAISFDGNKKEFMDNNAMFYWTDPIKGICGPLTNEIKFISVKNDTNTLTICQMLGCCRRRVRC